VPAFVAVIQEWGDSTLLDSVACAPSFRWRFDSDGLTSDADGDIDTDGGAFVDNVWVRGDPGNLYIEDFEHGSWDTLQARGWSKPDPVGKIDAWHVFHDSDPPYEGGDGGDRNTCLVDSSNAYRSRPLQGYPSDMTARCGWHYRLVSPRIPIPEGNAGSGCVCQYDMFMCCLDYTCDYTDTKVRFYDSDFGRWCPWISPDGIPYNSGGCFFWSMDFNEDVTRLYGPDADSVQFGWDAIHIWEGENWICCNKGSPGRNHNLQVDNVSIGFFDGSATVFRARGQDLLHDTFHDSICAYNSMFDVYDLDTLREYSGPPYATSLPKSRQLYIDVIDKDGVQEVWLHGSIDRGSSWHNVEMQQAEPLDPYHPDLGGDYYATFCPTDFALSRWLAGTEVWYYVKCEDQQANHEYFPSTADPGDPHHTGLRDDYFTFSILPMFPPEHEDAKILLVDDYGGNVLDLAECIASSSKLRPLEDIYGDILRDAGYCYDRYDISGAGGRIHIHPLHFLDYDAVVWFCGPHLMEHLIDKEAQIALRLYLNIGGKVILCGDRLAYNMCDPIYDCVGADSLGGEFMNGIMGCTYMEEMESVFDKPYVYLEAAESVEVFGTWIPIPMDSLLVYRQCPDAKDMSYVVTNQFPPAGYTAQPLLHVLDPPADLDSTDAAIYVEKPGEGGQCVFINYDLAGFVTHQQTECDGSVPTGFPPHQAGSYYGRVELLRTILENLFGLDPVGPGQGGTADLDHDTLYKWKLHQNSPNPSLGESEIRFEVARPGRISIKVYDAGGRFVRTLENRRLAPGAYSVHWNGTNASGRRVSSGVYFYRLEAQGFSATRKLLLLK
jgi:hypothetical protein